MMLHQVFGKLLEGEQEKSILQMLEIGGNAVWFRSSERHHRRHLYCPSDAGKIQSCIETPIFCLCWPWEGLWKGLHGSSVVDPQKYWSGGVASDCYKRYVYQCQKSNTINNAVTSLECALVYTRRINSRPPIFNHGPWGHYRVFRTCLPWEFLYAVDLIIISDLEELVKVWGSGKGYGRQVASDEHTKKCCQITGRLKPNYLTQTATVPNSEGFPDQLRLSQN